MKYVPSYEIAERMRAEAALIMEQRLEQERYEMAAKMKAEGIEVGGYCSDYWVEHR